MEGFPRCFIIWVHVCVPSHFSSVWLFSTSWTVAHQAPLPMGFSRQEYWSWLPCPLQGIFLTQESNPYLLGLQHWQAGPYHCHHHFKVKYEFIFSFPSGSVVKNTPAMQETQKTQVWSLSWEDLLVEGMASHSSILAWRFPWAEEPGGLQSMGSQRVRHNWSDWACVHMN